MADANQDPPNGVPDKEILREVDRQTDPDEFAVSFHPNLGEIPPPGPPAFPRHNFPELANHLKCYTCMMILPKGYFGRAQCRDNNLSRSGRRKTEKMTRICMGCAVRTNFYRHLEPVKWLGLRYHHCHQCGHIGTAGRRCKKVYEPYEDMPPASPPTLVCYDPDQEPGPLASYSPIELLSEELLRNIVQHLSYLDAIELERTCKSMGYAIRPTKLLPIHERYLHVNEKFTREIQVPWRKGRAIDFQAREKLPCFVCFRIRDKKHFSKKQIAMAQAEPRRSYRLRCGWCLDQLYLVGDKALLAQYNSYRMCPECQCLAAVAKRCENCAEWKATGKHLHGPPYPIPQMPLPEGTDTEIFERMIGSPPDPRREYHYLTPTTFPLRKKPVIRSDPDRDEDAIMRKLIENAWE